MEPKSLNKIFKVIMAIIITALITFLITSMYYYKRYKTAYEKLLLSRQNTSSSSASDGLFSQFKSILEQKYIGEIDDEKMTEAAIKGYINGLGDPYTEYLTKNEMKKLVEETSSEYVGIGVYLSNDTSKDQILVVGLFKDSPAIEAGMEPGDYIIKVDGNEYKGSQLEEAISILKGKEDTEVKVTVLRDNKEKELTVTRKKIEVKHVGSKVLSDNIGYILIDSFEESVSEDFEKQVNEMIENDKIDKLIIDLRSNGGGIVKEATEIADLFTEKDGTLLITKSKNSEEKITKAEKELVYKDLKVVVLVNQYSASASEILAAALRENFNAKIIGMKTYGKGVIQTVYGLTDGSGLKITTDEYFTPKHNEINKIGITPDVEVELTKDSNGKYEVSEDKDAQLLKAIEELKK